MKNVKKDVNLGPVLDYLENDSRVERQDIWI